MESFTWKDLKEFINTLSDEQLEHEVDALDIDEDFHSIEGATVLGWNDSSRPFLLTN